jgi:Ca2+-binding EF-hand superfamily protein
MADQIKEILNDQEKFNAVARAGFDAVDTDKSGQIDSAELEKAMGEISKEIGVDPPTKEEVSEILTKLDTDKSGKLSFDEFSVFIRRILEALAGSA